MTDDRPDPLNVLFLCTGNSARSIIAEAIMNRRGAGQFLAFSAGSVPRGEVHPRALEILMRHNFPVEGLRSKSWEEFAEPDAPSMDFVFTVCNVAAAENCPPWPGRPITANWGVRDPAAVTGDDAQVMSAFADTVRHLANRINLFVRLPLESLDRLSLQNRLTAIGREDEAAPQPT